jgi:hypothetical protein
MTATHFDFYFLRCIKWKKAYNFSITQFFNFYIYLLTSKALTFAVFKSFFQVKCVNRNGDMLFFRIGECWQTVFKSCFGVNSEATIVLADINYKNNEHVQIESVFFLNSNNYTNMHILPNILICHKFFKALLFLSISSLQI